MKRKLTIFILLALLLAMLALPVQAEEGLYYVTDDAELLADDKDVNIEYICQSISEEYEIGVYIVTVDDYTDYGEGSVYDVTAGIYHEYTMGKGEERNGIMLLLSMAERDYATFVYGEDALYAFNDYALQQLEEKFLPYFGEDDWRKGFETYAVTCEEYLGLAAAGEPLEESNLTTYLLVIGIAFLIALIVVTVLKAGMKNVRENREADVYVSRQLNLTQHHDQFTHITTTRRKIETNSDSASKAHSGGGGRGRSGKF